MGDIRKGLSLELEATTVSLQRRVLDLQRDMTKLQRMLSGSEEEWDQYQFQMWTQGGAAHDVAEIASLLSRQQILQEVLSKLPLE